MSDVTKSTVVDETQDDIDPVVIKDKWWLVGDNQGNGSISTTMLLISFILVSASFILNMFNVKIVKAFDVGAVTAYFTPIVGLYFGRQWTKSK